MAADNPATLLPTINTSTSASKAMGGCPLRLIDQAILLLIFVAARGLSGAFRPTCAEGSAHGQYRSGQACKV